MRTDAATFVIEVEGTAAGLVRREGGGFRFFAADADFRSIDRKWFASARQAASAVHRTKPGRGSRLEARPAREPRTVAGLALAMLRLLPRRLSRLGTARSGASAPVRAGEQAEHRAEPQRWRRGPTRASSSASPPSAPAIARKPEQGASGSQAVAIIGAGFSGSLLALHLLREGRSAPRIYLFERQPSFGRGLAYSSGNTSHRVNTRAANMSAFPSRRSGNPPYG